MLFDNYDTRIVGNNSPLQSSFAEITKSTIFGIFQS